MGSVLVQPTTEAEQVHRHAIIIDARVITESCGLA